MLPPALQRALDANRPDQAESLCRRALATHPDRADLHNLLGLLHRNSGQPAFAAPAFARAVALDPLSADYHYNLANALAALHHRDQAILIYRRAIELDPNHCGAHYNLANVLGSNDDLDAAVAAYHRAIELRPDLLQAHGNLGAVLMRLGRFSDAMDSYNRALQLDPQSPHPRWNRALALLLSGDYLQGFAEYEWRNRLPIPSSPSFAQPRWTGENLANKTILLHAEHGLGDAIQFARYAPLLASQHRGARVILRCQSELKELFTTLAGIDQVLSDADPLPPFDVHCPLLSLPHIFRTRLDSIPHQVPYLTPDARRAAQWQTRLAASPPRRRIGLAWAGDPLHQYDRQRSIHFSQLLPLLSIPNLQFIHLQKGPAAAQAQPHPRLIDHTSLLHDLADTAALISHLDLIISVDTSVAHLAAALAKTVWLLVPYSPDWRWLLNRNDSPWYPTIELFRQPARADWTPVIHSLAKRLHSL